MQQRDTIQVRVGGVTVGGGAPVRVQSMTNTDTADAQATIQQVLALAKAGSEVVRITVNNEESAAQVAHIKAELQKQGCDVPLVGDFHYNGHRLLQEYPECAKALDKYRINPGNVGFGEKKDTQFQQIIEAAIEYDKPVRIGVNWGSLDQSLLTELMNENAKLEQPKEADEVAQEALIQSALRSAEAAKEIGLAEDKIILSCKVSRVPQLISVYRELAKRCRYPLHLGLTEAGMGIKGMVSSTAALATLLQDGIGDTIRVSLTPKPGAERTEEVAVAQEILQSLELRAFSPQVTACPGCGRTTSTFFQELAERIETHVKAQMPIWSQHYPGAETLNLAVMGCIVNGPGESKHADIGISLPGTGESPAAPVFVDGKKVTTLRGENIAEEFIAMIDDYVQERYGKKDAA